jgi:hypothetical protein
VISGQTNAQASGILSDQRLKLIGTHVTMRSVRHRGYNSSKQTEFLGHAFRIA